MSPMQQSGLTFSVQAAAFKNTDKEASVALAIEVDGTNLQFAPKNNNTVFADNVELSFFSLSQQGKAQKGVRSELTLTLRPETYERVRLNGVRMNPRITLAPGRYQIRIGTRESGAGHTGSVFYDLVVPDFTKDSLMLSGVLLSAPSAEMTPTAQPDDLVKKLLPGAPTSRREFARTDTLSLLAEIYDNNSSRQPRQFDATVKLLAENGTEAFVAHDALTNSGDANKWDVYAYTKSIPLKDVAPGRYLVHVEVQPRTNAKNAKPVVQEVLIAVR